MAGSLFGRMIELAESGSNSSEVEPIVITNDMTTSGKLTIDLNINLHVFNHESKSTND